MKPCFRYGALFYPTRKMKNVKPLPQYQRSTQLVIGDNEYFRKYIFRGDSDGGMSFEYVAGAPTPAFLYNKERFEFH